MASTVAAAKEGAVADKEECNWQTQCSENNNSIPHQGIEAQIQLHRRRTIRHRSKSRW